MDWLSKKRAEWLRLKEEWPKVSWGRRLKLLENFVDDPIDNIKHKLHGMKLPFGYRLNISFLMKNRPTTWPIIYKDEHHDDTAK